MPALISLDSVVAVSDQQVAAVLGDEVVILGLDEGAYFGLRAAGSRVWALIQQPQSLREVVEVLVTEFDVDRGRCEQDVLALVASLAARRLITVKAGGAPAC